MARSALYDHLQVYPFWLMDIGPTEAFNLPMLTPIFGFSGITMPEIQLETQEIKEGNWPFARKVVKGGTVNSITLSRGVSWDNSDFWKWVVVAAIGNTAPVSTTLTVLTSMPGVVGMGMGGVSYRRTLLLIQYYPHISFPGSVGVTNALQTAAAGSVYMGAIGTTGYETAILAPTVAATYLATANIGPFEFAARVPARGFILKDVIPKRYKTGSDLDASSGAVQIQELELEVELFEEINLGLP